MKALIPAAGKGTRMEPFTKAFPKELLPVGDRAVIQHGIELIKNADIDDVCVVIGWKQHAVLDYLESGDWLEVDINYAVQEDRSGLGTAVTAGRQIIDGEEFAVVLGDSYFSSKEFLSNLRQLHEDEGATVTLAGFPVDDVSSYGVIEHTGHTVERVVEKPDPDEVDSGLAIAGAYIFEPEIFDALDSISRGRGNEYQLTDAIQHLIDEGATVRCLEIDGRYIDVGTPDRLKEANRVELC